MKTYDVVVIGSGCGGVIKDEALQHGMKVALVDKGPLGGTCCGQRGPTHGKSIEHHLRKHSRTRGI